MTYGVQSARCNQKATLNVKLRVIHISRMRVTNEKSIKPKQTFSNRFHWSILLCQYTEMDLFLSNDYNSIDF